MPLYSALTKQELNALRDEFSQSYNKVKDMKFNLDISRGKPGSDQLSLSDGLIDCLKQDDYISQTGYDCRNYGVLDGLPEMKKIFADIMGLDPEEIIVGGNSSLSMMFDNVSSNMSHGVRDGRPWARQGTVKFICPSPGYDRHFAICEYFHADMITVEMTPTGPDMDKVEQLVSSDPMIKGIWCVPRYSNPAGIVYSDETVYRMANLKPAAPDFRIYWDDAYCIHSFDEPFVKIPNILRECEKAGNENMPLIFASFSKISFAGSGVSMIGTSKSNCDYIRRRLAIQTIGPDKLNQLRHVRFFKNLDGVLNQMEKHAQLLRPRFHTVYDILDRELSGKGIAEWTKPRGGYFISFNSMDGCANRIVSLCKEAGLTLTPAGTTFPYGIDPRDRNIRIAPSFPSIPDLKDAMEIFCTSVLLASTEKLLNLF